MSLFISSLNSGSNGNCYYIGNDAEAVLIDTGISCRETETRMQQLGLCMQKVKAIFISHEHTDHTKGLATIATKYKLPVYITTITLRHSGIQLGNGLATTFEPEQPVQIGRLLITAFSKFHDAEDPHSFIISFNGITVGVFTDIGAPCNNVRQYFTQCHAAFLEANYDEALLENGRYPYFLKKRIRGGMGHLSNKQALEIFTRHRPAFMTHLLLSHLSKDNNCPELAKRLFEEQAGNTMIAVASRYKQTPVYTIQQPATMPVIKKTRPEAKRIQLSLFEAFF